MRWWSALRSDWQWHRAGAGGRAGRLPLLRRSFLLVANHRLAHAAHGVRIPLLGGALRACSKLTGLALEMLTGAIIRPDAEIGQRLTVHTSHGLLVTSGTRLGDGCTLNAGVKIVERADGIDFGHATVGDDVWIGVDAKILGTVRIGDHCVVGAAAVVLHDIPSHHIAVGHPARSLPRRYLRE